MTLVDVVLMSEGSLGLPPRHDAGLVEGWVEIVVVSRIELASSIS